MNGTIFEFNDYLQLCQTDFSMAFYLIHMTSESIPTSFSSSGKKFLGDLGKGIKKLHTDFV